MRQLKLIAVLLFLILAGCSSKEGMNEPGQAKQNIVPTDPKLLETGLVVVDFYADWCMPCKEFEPVFLKTSIQFSKKVNFLRINIDNDRTNAEKFSIISIPTIVFLKDGQELDRIIGGVPAGEFESKLRTVFKI